MTFQIKDYPALSLFSELLTVPSPSGNEKKLAAIIEQKITELGFFAQRDAIGNIYTRIEGRDPSAPLCLIAAHIDEIGIVVTGIEPDGNLKVVNSGGLLPHKLGERPLKFLGDHKNIIGVSAMGSAHTTKVSDKAKTWEDVSIFTGLTPAQLKEAGIRPGTCGVPTREQCGPLLFGDEQDPLAAAWTFDDRMGAVALLRLLEQVKIKNIQPLHPTVLAFTTQEETGGHGAKVLARALNPQTFISVDGCPIPPGIPLSLDGRPGIWSRDKSGPYDQNLVRFLYKASLESGTEAQPAAFAAAFSDASMVQSAGLTERIAVIGHVRENSHGYEIARVSVFDNLLQILVRFLETWQGE